MKGILNKFENHIKLEGAVDTLEGRAAVQSRNFMTFNKDKYKVLPWEGLTPETVQAGGCPRGAGHGHLVGAGLNVSQQHALAAWRTSSTRVVQTGAQLVGQRK